MAFTIIEKILLAAYTLEQTGSAPFTAEQLIVEAWEKDKDLFGLQGYSDQHPDSNRVLSNIMGHKGLRAKGWIERVGEKQYLLTASGTRIAKNLVNGEVSSTKRAGTLGRKHILIAQRLINSPAFKKRTKNEEKNIIFRDACNYWGISAYSNAATLYNQFTDLRDVLDELEKAVDGSSNGVVALPGMKILVNKDLVASLRETHEVLQSKFFNELEVVRKRQH